MPNINAQTIAAAKAAGYSDSEIAAHIAQVMPQQVATARKAGYSDSEIVAHLGLMPDQGMGEAAARGAANGATAGWADKLRAAAETVVPASVLDAVQSHIPGLGSALPQSAQGTHTVWENGSWQHPLNSLANAYAGNRTAEQQTTAAAEQQHPWASGAGNVAGAVGLGAASAGLGDGLGALANTGKVGRVIAAVAPDAAYGASYGAGQSQANDFAGQAKDAAYGAVGGIAGHVAGNALGKVVTGVTDPIMRDLAARGVTFTPGQIMGGAARTAEQKLSSIPFAGDAIRARLADSGAGWQNATLNRAMESIGAKLPDGKAGTDAMAYAGKAFDDAYSEARSGMQFQRTPDFESALGQLKDRVTNGGVDSLSDSYQAKFDNVLKNTVERRMPDGVMGGDTYKTVVSDLKRAAAKAAGGVDTEAREYAGALTDLAGIIDGTAKQVSDPAAVAKLNAADQGYRLLVLSQKAADRGSSQTPGIVTPQKYLGAVEQGDTTVRNRAFNEGRAHDQQWGVQGLNALGPNIPNSFTADRSMMAALAEGMLAPKAAGMVAGLGAPATGAALGVGLPAAAIAGTVGYSRPVVNAFNKAAFAGGATRAKIGKAVKPILRSALTGAGAANALNISANATKIAAP